MNIVFNGVWRMDWGFGNPNVTAAFIGSLAIGIWFFAYRFSRGFWFALAAFIPLIICLLHTMSRGGLLGTAIGLGILAFYAPKPWPKVRLLAIIGTIWIGAISAVLLKTSERLSMGIVHEDLSISNRLSVWKFAPQMLFDAPWGVGWGQSGTTFMAWYQPTERHEKYLSLVNTHLSKIVELGILGGLLYVFLWIVALAIALPNVSNRWRSVPFGILVSFGISASFTNLAPWPLVWALPVFSVLLCLLHRSFTSSWPPLPVWLKCGAISMVAIMAMLILGAQQASFSPKIHFSDGMLKMGTGEPGFIIVPDTTVMGREYARSLRSYISRIGSLNQTILFTNSIDKMSRVDGKTVVFAGESMGNEKSLLKDVLSHAENVVLLSPKLDPREMKLDSQKTKKVRALFGEFSQSQSIDAWKDYASVERIDGVGEFFPNWPDLLFSERR
ncbi:hypothetical protein BH09VER1_BH09VER1_26360 [soil metagenome]